MAASISKHIYFQTSLTEQDAKGKSFESTVKAFFICWFLIQNRYFINQTELYVLTKHINQFKRNRGTFVVFVTIVPSVTKRVQGGQWTLRYRGGPYEWSLGLQVCHWGPSGPSAPTHPAPLLEIHSLGPCLFFPLHTCGLDFGAISRWLSWRVS